MDTHNPLRILAADLSLRCPGFAILVYSEGRVTVEKLCHLNSRKTKSGHGETLAAIYDLLSG